MTGAIDRTFVRLGWAILTFLVVAFLLLVVNQTADFVDLVSTGWSPEAGRVTLWVLIGAWVLLLLVPAVLLLRLPEPLVPPEVDEGPEFEKYLNGLRQRLKGNPRLVGQPLGKKTRLMAR